MRLDVYLVECGKVKSRTLAARLIEEGAVSVCGKVAKKPSEKVNEGDEVTVMNNELCRYVSRGGLKLEAALTAFSLDVTGLRAFDFGSSTGGFTDCLLKHGAAHVYSVDVGRSQLVESVKCDARVSVLEETDARTVTEEHLGEKCDLGVMDVSFISQSLLYPSCAHNLKTGGFLVTLYKPQFEVGRQYVGKGGIVKDLRAVERARETLVEKAALCGLKFVKHIPSPILGGDGNYEELLYFVRCEHV
ncbi:MAG: TlyA family RNA methyltransferase [Clostridia bacterium]|nr:TlyA family RNA methyltransferase [Clostridia bacterium]